MKIERRIEMLKAIEANEKASEMFSKLWDMITHNFCEKKWDVDEIIEVTFNTYCK